MPALTAISGSVQPLYRLLRCLNFTHKAHVQIGKDGIRFSVDDSRAVQGLAFLDRALFTSFRLDGIDEQTETEEVQDAANEFPAFQISFGALLEAMSIFGATETGKDRFVRDPYASGIEGARGAGSAAFENRTLGISGTCCLDYRGLGSPLNVTLEEGNITTTCALTTYESEILEDIPFARDMLAFKVIMQANLLHDAIQELNAFSPDTVTIFCSPGSTASSLILKANGAFGATSVSFTSDSQLLETFNCPYDSVNSYKFSMIKAAAKTMAIANKVSIRADSQGVLSLQFMVELAELESKISFVDFRFIPLLSEENAEDEEAGSPGETGL